MYKAQYGFSVAFLIASFFASGIAESHADSRIINGAGATFPYPLYAKWFSEFQKIAPDVRINYQSIGSGGGVRQLLAKTIDFARAMHL